MNQPQDLAFEFIIQGISIIEEKEAANLHRELSRLQKQNNELRKDIQMKKKLLNIQKSTNQTLDSMQKMMRKRATVYEQIFKNLQAQLRDKSSIVRNFQASQTPQTQTSQNSDNAIIDFHKRANDLQRHIEDENRNHELRLNDEIKKVEQYELKLQNLNQELKHLRTQDYQVKYNSTLENTCSRQLDELKLQIEQKNSHFQKLQMENQTLKKEIEQLHTRLACNTASKNEVTIKQVIKQPGNIQELTQLKTINQELSQQNQQIKKENIKLKIIEMVKQNLEETKNRCESIRSRFRYLEDQVSIIRTGANSSTLPSENISDSLPSDSIGQQSIKIKKKQKYDLDAQQLNEDRRVRMVEDG